MGFYMDTAQLPRLICDHGLQVAVLTPSFGLFRVDCSPVVGPVRKDGSDSE